MTPARRQPEPPPAEKLRQLALRVRRLACSGRCDPEQVVMEKEILSAELRRLARYYMGRERAGQTLQTTALVNEAYLRLVDQRNVRWQNRAHFFAIAAQLMRRILVDRARKRYNSKRGGNLRKVSLDGVADLSGERDADLIALDDALTLREAGLNIVGVGFTVYLGSAFESEQMREAAQACFKAHRAGMLAVLWVYPRGAAVPDETDPHLIAGATGLGATLGADFVKVNYPKPKEGSQAESFREAVKAAGRTRVITAGGGSTDVRKFLQTLHDQIFIAGAHGSATGRNIHQKALDEAVRMTNAISAITYGGQSVDEAMAIYEGRAQLSL